MNVLRNKYGYLYYPYKDDSGKQQGLPMLDWVYDQYYSKGYLTDVHLDEMLKGKTITFNVPNASKSGTRTITARVVPYTNKKGRITKIIEFPEADVDGDIKVINANLEKIATSYWDSGSHRFDFKKPQAYIDSLSLDQDWRTYAINEILNGDRYGIIQIYKKGGKREDNIVLYCTVDESKDLCEMITEEQYKSAKQSHADEELKVQKEHEKKIEDYKTVKKDLNTFIDKIEEETTRSPYASNEFVDDLDRVTEGIDVPDIQNFVAGLLTSKKSNYFREIFEDARNQVGYININNFTEKDRIARIKFGLLKRLRIFMEYRKIRNVRELLLAEIESSGLASVIEDVSIDEALDLGSFRTVQKALVKYGTNAPKGICLYLYEDIIDPELLKKNLLTLLKIYDAFYDMPEKDRKSIAKFVAKNKLSEYYDRVSAYDDVLEVLIDESRDPKLLKPLLTSIAGTSRANYLKDKTFYFERRARLKDDIILFKPIELLEDLRDCIKAFNVSSNVAILTNIELDADETFIFQFYTFSDESDGSDFDGRRIQYMTKIYNMHHPTQKIGFVFDN